MRSIKPFLLLLLLSPACQPGDSALSECNGGKCDAFGADFSGRLMPKAPQVRGSLKLSRSSDDYRVEVVGPKAELVLLTPSFASPDEARSAADVLEVQGVEATNYEVVPSGPGWAYRLRGEQGETLAEGAVLDSPESAAEAARDARDLVASLVQYEAAVRGGAHFEVTRGDGTWSLQLQGEDGQSLLATAPTEGHQEALDLVEELRRLGKSEASYQVSETFELRVVNDAGQEVAHAPSRFSSEEEALQTANDLQALLRSERVASPY